MNETRISKGDIFLDSEGNAWRTSSPAGTGQYSWWCSNVDTDEDSEFTTEFITERIRNYTSDIKKFEIKEKLESDMFNLVKKISNKIIRTELLSENDWTDGELDILSMLRKGEFNIECQ